LNLDYSVVGYPRPGASKEYDAGFASCLRVIDPVTMETEFLQEFENETAFSMYVSKG
jgi:hypothetical protein